MKRDPQVRAGASAVLGVVAVAQFMVVLDASVVNVAPPSLQRDVGIHIDRIVFALDCGRNVNPDLIRAQVEGGLLWG